MTRLARKMAILRVASVLLGAVLVVSIVLMAASGTMTVRGSPNGGRFVSDGVIRTIAFSESPIIYLAVTLYYIAMGVVVAGCFYLVLAKLVQRLDRRPIFRRKYPY